MDFFTAYNISASGLSAQRTRLNTITSNLANINTTQTPEGGPYRRKDVVFTAIEEKNSFNRILKDKVNAVKVEEIIEDSRPFKFVYDPYHPDANKEGYVAYPNIEMVEEMVNMLSASRHYEANINAVKTTTKMAQKALTIGR
jgi:flagellar basal-body rod protein FlgC